MFGRKYPKYPWIYLSNFSAQAQTFWISLGFRILWISATKAQNSNCILPILLVINSLKMLGCATNQDSLLLATLRYIPQNLWEIRLVPKSVLLAYYRKLLYCSFSNNPNGILKKVLPLSHDGNSKFCVVGKHNWNHTLKCQTYQSPAFLEVDLKTFPINIHPQWNFQTKKRAFM